MTDERPIEELDPEVIPADGEDEEEAGLYEHFAVCLLYTSPSPRDCS
mgnify:CR=1 FL=1